MRTSFLKAFVKRHRYTLTDISVVAVIVAVGLALAAQFNFFLEHGEQDGIHEIVEVDEVLLSITTALLYFGGRRYFAHRRESKRRLAAEQHIRVLAFQDPLTGLANRRQFDDALKAATSAPPREGAVHAVLLLDLNGFKQINDVYGHATGDEVLAVTAQRLLTAMREGDLVARLGGDEFAILTQHLASPEAATSVARRIIDELKEPIVVASTRHMVGSGIGIALFPSDASTPAEMLRKADLALYRAKEERRSAMHFFEDVLDDRMRERDWLEQELRSAVAAGSIETVFEPTVELNTNRITGFEASPRWLHPTQGEIPADRFLAIAEESGLIHDLMETVLRQACNAAVHWPHHVVLSVDIVPIQLKDRSLDLRILDILRDTALPPERLEIEITESALVRDLDRAQAVLGALRNYGVRIALDNFGTGYSSLYHLRNFKLDKIKIDSSFIRSMHSEQQSADIVRALVGLAHGLGLTVAADGIEHDNQQHTLLLTGCEQGQGHLYSEPMSAEQTLLACSTSVVA